MEKSPPITVDVVQFDTNRVFSLRARGTLFAFASGHYSPLLRWRATTLALEHAYRVNQPIHILASVLLLCAL